MRSGRHTPQVTGLRRRSPAAVLGVLAVTVVATAQDGGQAKPDQRDARHLFVDSADDVLSKLSDLRFDRKSVTTFDPFTGVRADLKKLNKKLHEAAKLRVGFAWTSVYQHATASMGPEDAAASDFDFFGRWMPLRTRSTLGYVIFETQARNNFVTDITPNDLGD